MPAPSPYQQLVLDHSRAPRGFGTLAAPTHAADGDNPLCGDHLRVELVVRDGRIVEHAFRGEGCAIALASASMLAAHLGGLAQASFDPLAEQLRDLVEGRIDHAVALGDLNALGALAQYPSRRRCALLAFASVRAALDGERRASTESPAAMRPRPETP